MNARRSRPRPRTGRPLLMLAAVVLLTALAGSISAATAASTASTQVTYPGPFELTANGEFMNWDEVWDLTQGDLTLSYRLDMSQITQPAQWPTGWVESPPGSGNWVFDTTPTTNPSKYPDTFTPWIEVGMRGVGGDNYNPGPANTYQGKCGGWMTSESDDWLGTWTLDENGRVVLVDDGTDTQDGDDKHSLGSTSGVGEWFYDVLDGDKVKGVDAAWDTIITNPAWETYSPEKDHLGLGSHNNHGLWYDRDGVDQWQATAWGNSGENAGRINTNGVYDIVITYHAIDDGLGVMFATVNGVQQGFFKRNPDGTYNWGAVPENYPAGISFKGDMKQMQVFAGSFAYDPAGHDYGTVALSDIVVDGVPGTANPLVPDFTAMVGAGDVVSFDASATHGGMGPYTYMWDFDNDGTVDETTTSPTTTHTFATGPPYTVKLTVDPYRCKAYGVAKTITATGTLDVVKFYDANANGVKDAGEQVIPGWKYTIGGTEYLTGTTLTLPLGTYTVAEVVPAQGSWVSTTPASVQVTLGAHQTVTFGNVCLGAGGGLTPGYWSNKNGENTFDDVIGAGSALSALEGLHLWQMTKSGDVTGFDPTTYKQFRDWLQARNAVDMRYQLSAHLAAMTLNVMSGFVDGDALVYAGTLGFVSVDDLMAAADAALAQSTPDRAVLEQLKIALDRANNNLTFVQAVACPVSY